MTNDSPKDAPSEEQEPRSAPVPQDTSAGPASASGSRWTTLHEGVVLKNQRLVRLLGRGGMGEVWESENTHVKTLRSALKVVRPELAQESSFRERFFREVTLLAGLAHENILAVRDFAVDDATGIPFLVTELLEGEDLAHRLERARQQGQVGLAVGDVGHLMRQAAAGVAFAHDNAVVHRDLKPLNLFVTTRGVVKVLDFGIARAGGSSQLTKTSAGIPGSPGYFAPEFVDGQAASPASDVYALGVTLFELLAGRLPFEGGGDTDEQRAMTTMVQHATKPPPPLSSLRPDVPAALAVLVERCLSKQPTERPTAHALAESLIEFAHSSTLAQTPTTQPGLPSSNDTAQQTRFGIVPAAQLGERSAGSSSSSETRFGIAPSKAAMAAADVPPPAQPSSRRGLVLAGLGVLAVGSAVGFAALRAPSSSADVVVDAGVAAAVVDAGVVETVPVPPGFVLVPGRTGLRLGSPSPGPLDVPQHTVDVPAFFIQKTEVSIGEFQAFLDATRPGVKLPGAPASPVTSVAWPVAKAYCEWRGGRLPTEDEWERAARRNGTARFPWGDTINPACLPTELVSTASTPPAGCASAEGVVRLLGNVWEWTSSPVVNPKTGARVAGMYATRGGSYASPVDRVDATSRAPAKSPDDKTGFRCAIEASGPTAKAGVSSSVQSPVARPSPTGTVRRVD